MSTLSLTSPRSAWKFFAILMLSLFGFAKAGCDYSIAEQPEIKGGLKINVNPQQAEIQKGTTLQLTATVSGFKSDGSVTWSIFGDQIGSLTTDQLTATYSAPATLTKSPTTVTIRVRSNEDTSRFAQATLTIIDTLTGGGGNNGQVAITINPLSVTLAPGRTQQFNATVTGSTNTGVTWTMVSGTGTINSTGLYTAPNAIAASETAVIQAASVADPTKTIRATITIRQAVDPNLVCFERDVMPIFASNCTMSGCHSGNNPPEGLNFTTYEGILRGFEDDDDDDDDDDEDHNEILEKITESDPEDRMPPPPRSPLTPEQIQTIRKWIQQGAKNEDCTETGGNDCDTVSVSYANFVRPMIQNTCLGCHSTGNSGNKNVNLSTLAGVQAVANSGQLIGALSHAQGFTPMPMNMSKLDDCTIAKIRSWIRDGARDN
jgi:mono/diheme cytochrome c family protein